MPDFHVNNGSEITKLDEATASVQLSADGSLYFWAFRKFLLEGIDDLLPGTTEINASDRPRGMNSRLSTLCSCDGYAADFPWRTTKNPYQFSSPAGLQKERCQTGPGKLEEKERDTVMSTRMTRAPYLQHPSMFARQD